MKWNTFDGWKDEGFWVKKGEKSILRQPDGKCLFNNNQVEKYQDLDDLILTSGDEFWKK